MKEPTDEKTHELLSELLHKGSITTLTEVRARMWASYIVYKMRMARTQRELILLRNKAFWKCVLPFKSGNSGTTPAYEWELNMTRLENSIWGNGIDFYEFADGQLAPNLKDDRGTADLANAGYVAFAKGELPPELVRWVERSGFSHNHYGWISQLIQMYQEEFPH